MLQLASLPSFIRRLLKFFALLVLALALLAWQPQLKKYLARCFGQLPVSSRVWGPPKGDITTPEMAREKGCSIEYLESGGIERFHSFLKEMPSTQIYPNKSLLHIEHGRVYSEKGVVIGPNDRALYETTREFGSPTYKHPIFNRMYLPKITYLKGSWALLALAGQYTYYHWMLEVLPRLEVLEQAHATYDGLLVPELRLSFMRDTLQMMGVEPSKCKVLAKRCHIDVEDLIIPSAPITPATIFASTQTVQWLRERFHSYRQQPTTHSSFIFISRSKAPSRRIVNESELMAYLQPYGFESVHLEDLSVQEQIALFAHAKVIIAPHGSGLTNLVFCDLSCQVVEIHSPFWLNGCFGTICQQLNLDYRSMYATATPGDRYDIEVDMVNFQALTDLLLKRLSSSTNPN